MKPTKTIHIGTFIIIFYGFRFALQGNTGAAIMAALVLYVIIINNRLRALSKYRQLKIIDLKNKCVDCKNGYHS